MKRKTFLRTSSVMFAGGMVTPLLSRASSDDPGPVLAQAERTNWAGNYTYKAEHLHEPSSAAEVQELVARLDRQKALGSRHCFNDIADSPQHQISTRGLDQVIALDTEKKTLTVGAGARYGDFSEWLHAEGFALHNLASLPHITVAGACATATHGSGVTNGNLATAVLAVELVTPAGELVTIDRDHPDFPAVVVGLGAFGIVTAVTLRVQDTFAVRQDVFLDLPLASLAENFDAIMSAGYSVSLFTDWLDGKVSEVWVKRRVEADTADLGEDFYGARAATENVHPIVGLPANSCSEQLGVPGPWYDRLPHFRMGFTPSAGEELQSEYFVPRAEAVAAILAVEALKDEIQPHLLISEIRTIAADEFWMSPCYRRDAVAIHFTWRLDTAAVMAVLPQIEAALAPYDVRPHWGKLFTVEPRVLYARYERYGDFVALAERYDPAGKFRNGYLTRNLY